MKKQLWCALAWVFSLLALQAQVTVEIQSAQEQYLPGEAVNMAVRISNMSGQSLRLGADANWLSFSVESKDGFLVSEMKPLAVEGEFELESSKVATKRVNIAPGFDMSRVGTYSVSANVNVKAWGEQFGAKSKPFSVVQGTKLWEQTFGLPQSTSRPNDPPEVRRYTLQQANYLKQLKLYVRITAAEDDRIVKVFQAGPMISFSRPEAQVDRMSNLHVLWQTGARVFAYRIFTPDGETIGSQTHAYTDTRPHLTIRDDGQLEVVGGARQPSRDDLPAVTVPMAAPTLPGQAQP